MIIIKIIITIVIVIVVVALQLFALIFSKSVIDATALTTRSNNIRRRDKSHQEQDKPKYLRIRIALH